MQTTIKEWLDSFIAKYTTKEDFKTDLNRMIEDLEADKTSPYQLAFYKRVRNKLIKIEARLETLRTEIRAERISYGEIFELQGLAKYIEKGDVELLQWAGVEEFAE
jgi:hypothetical protein